MTVTADGFAVFVDAHRTALMANVTRGSLLEDRRVVVHPDAEEELVAAASRAPS